LLFAKTQVTVGLKRSTVFCFKRFRKKPIDTFKDGGKVVTCSGLKLYLVSPTKVKTLDRSAGVILVENRYGDNWIKENNLWTISSVEEHLLYTENVGGSNPSSSTTFIGM
jgi:hypothetical protein